MTRKSTLLFFCAAAALLISVPTAFAQQQAKLQKLNPAADLLPVGFRYERHLREPGSRRIHHVPRSG
jgi:hypothetical protein